VHQAVAKLQVEALREIAGCEAFQLLARVPLETVPNAIPEAKSGQSVDAANEKDACGESVLTFRALFGRDDIEALDTLAELVRQAGPIDVDLIEPYARCKV